VLLINKHRLLTNDDVQTCRNQNKLKKKP